MINSVSEIGFSAIVLSNNGNSDPGAILAGAETYIGIAEYAAAWLITFYSEEPGNLKGFRINDNGSVPRFYRL